MSSSPVNAVRVARAAASRAMVGEFLRFAGWALLGGAGVGLLAVGAAKLAWPAMVGGMWALIGGPLAAAVAVAAAVAAWRRWSAARAARELDQRLGLKDALGSGLALAGEKGAFAAWAVGEAERAAAAVKVNQVVRLRADWPWGLWPVVTAGAIATAIFAP